MSESSAHPAAHADAGFREVERATVYDAVAIEVAHEPLDDDLWGVRLELQQEEVDKPWVFLSGAEAARLGRLLLRMARGGRGRQP